MALRHLNVHSMSKVLNNKFYKVKTPFTRTEVSLFYKDQKCELTKLMIHFSKSFHNYDKKIFEAVDQFNQKFKYMIPVFGLDFYQDTTFNYNQKGITTVSFEDLKQFYVDTFELVTELLDIVIAFNNLKYRNNYQTMKTKRKDVSTLDKYQTLNKGAKLEFIDQIEVFDTLIYPSISNQIRNAIGHNSYEINVKEQLVLYYPTKSKNSEITDITLIDFTKTCWELFQSLMNISELIYQTRRFYLIHLGLSPTYEVIFDEKAKVIKNKSINKRKKLANKKN